MLCTTSKKTLNLSEQTADTVDHCELNLTCLEFTRFPNALCLRQDPTLGLCSCHVSLGSTGLWQFLRLLLFLTTLTVVGVAARCLTAPTAGGFRCFSQQTGLHREPRGRGLQGEEPCRHTATRARLTTAEGTRTSCPRRSSRLLPITSSPLLSFVLFSWPSVRVCAH